MSRYKNRSLGEYAFLAQDLKTGILASIINKLVEQAHEKIKEYDERLKKCKTEEEKNRIEIEKARIERETAKICLGAVVYQIQKNKQAQCRIRRFLPDSAETSFLINFLKIKKDNPLESDECFIYVNKFKKYCTTQLPINEEARKTLLADVEKIQSFMIDNEEKVVNYLANQEPELEILRTKIRELPNKYREYRKNEKSKLRNFMHNSNRDLMCDFLDMVLLRCDQLYMRDKDIKELHAQEERIYKALAIFVVMNIGSGWFSSGSKLRVMALDCLLKKDLEQYSFQQRIACLDALIDFLKEMEKPEFLPIEQKILDFRTNLKKRDLEPSFTHKTVSVVASGVTQLGLFCVAENVIPKAVDYTLNYAVGTVGGPIGEAAYLGSKYVLGRTLGLTMTAMSMWLAGKIGQRVGEKTASFIADRHNEADAQGIAKTLSKMSEAERIILFKYVNALLDSNLAEEKKKALRSGFGLKDGAKCVIKSGSNDGPKVTFYTPAKTTTSAIVTSAAAPNRP